MDLNQKLFFGILLVATQISFILSNEEKEELETDSYKKNAKIGRKFYLIVCMFVCLFICLFDFVVVHMFVCLFVRFCVCAYVCLLVCLFVCLFC
jgi:hypothetical protein